MTQENNVGLKCTIKTHIKMIKTNPFKDFSVKTGITKEDNKGDSALHLAVLHYGSKTKKIKSRKLITEAIIKHKDEVEKIIGEALKRQYASAYDIFNITPITTDQIAVNAGNEIGFRVVNDVYKPYILSNGDGSWAPLKPVTKKRKMGSEQIMIDKGTLFSCLGHKVEKK